MGKNFKQINENGVYLSQSFQILLNICKQQGDVCKRYKDTFKQYINRMNKCLHPKGGCKHVIGHCFYCKFSSTTCWKLYMFASSFRLYTECKRNETNANRYLTDWKRQTHVHYHLIRKRSLTHKFEAGGTHP